MNIGLYQSATALSALERWQDSVAQNITSSQTSGYRKRTVNFSALSAGELHTEKNSRVGGDTGMPLTFPKVNQGINFVIGETQPTRRELDVAVLAREDGVAADEPVVADPDPLVGDTLGVEQDVVVDDGPRPDVDLARMPQGDALSEDHALAA